MASTILVLGVAVLSLALAWKLLRSEHPEIRTAQDWEARKHDIDVQVLGALLDRDEERWLRACLSPSQFRVFQRKRARLTMRILRFAEEDAGMLMRLAQLAKIKGDPVLTERADQLVATALKLRLNLLWVKLYLALKWLFPSWIVLLPTFERRYRNLLECLVRAQQFGQALT